MRSRPSALGISYASIAVFTVLGSTAALTYTPAELPTSSAPALSADGTKVAFVSWFDRLVPDDTNSASDVFVRDLVTGAVTRASTTSAGAQSSAAPGAPRAESPDFYEADRLRRQAPQPALSAAGGRVAFLSDAPDLVPGDTNGEVDVFVKDLGTGEIVRASTTADGTQAHGSDILERRETNRATRHCGAKIRSIRRVALSADGRTVAFLSSAHDLVPGDTNGCPDVFVKDLRTGKLTRASTTAAGRQFGPGAAGDSVALSADGSTVAFTSLAGSLVPGLLKHKYSLYVKKLGTGALTRTVAGTGSAFDPSLSADGTKVAFSSQTGTFDPKDRNKSSDVFFEDLRTRTVTRVSLTARGTELKYGASSPLLSPDGTVVAFSSGDPAIPEDTNGTWDLFARDLRTGTVTRRSTAGDGAQFRQGTHGASVSNGGKVVAFSFGTNAYVRDERGLLRMTPHPDDSSLFTKLLHHLYG